MPKPRKMPVQPLPQPVTLGSWLRDKAVFGAAFAFIVTTFFSFCAAQDSRRSSESAAQSAKASLKAIEIQQAATFITSCSEINSVIPNTPDPLLVPISRTEPMPSFGSRSYEERNPVKLKPHTFENCRLYNYGTLPVVDVHIRYDAHFVPPGMRLASFNGVASNPRDRYPVFISGIPANSSAEFVLANDGDCDAIYVARYPEMTYEAPPDFKKTPFMFRDDEFSFQYLLGNCKHNTNVYRPPSSVRVPMKSNTEATTSPLRPAPSAAPSPMLPGATHM